MQSIIRGLKSVVGGGRNGVYADDDLTLREIERHAAKIAREAGELLPLALRARAERAVQGRQAI